MASNKTTFFAPQLFIPHGVTDISFYAKAFDAVELRSWRNDDGSIHVAELSIHGAVFHLHEEHSEKGQFEPTRTKGITAIVGLFVEDVHEVMDKALHAGAMPITPTQDYEHGYRQGTIQDPFGHQWLIETRI
ncbi:VOC family protein [Pinibacter soli]|uniref:VOC family protein n=1 Tax=Pinibacter soli TaxID=3044211 RepID=A0ABT6RDF8_9BACT|nr:VOC family protein [Pinibacter soli]MDI3320604.1 VOC family protein [Pinibacter soli]